jgi:hypothetical protein
MQLWCIDKENIASVPSTNLDLERRLERWIINDPSILDVEMVIVGHQVRTEFGGYIDVLGINREGDLVLVELKRNQTPRDVIAQCLDYASWICTLTYEQVTDIYRKYSEGKDLAETFQDAFEEQLPESINENHRLVIVAASLDDVTERIIGYLAEQHSLNINAVFFNIFKINGSEILGRSWLKDPAVVDKERPTGKRAPWTGYLFVNTGIGADEKNFRDWDLNRKYSYISAGGGKRWTKKIQKLRRGDKIFAYLKGSGYVGYGVVQEEAVPVWEYAINGTRFIDKLPPEHPWRTVPDDPLQGEWMAQVDWKKTFSADQAKWINNGFANQNVVCKLRDPRTFEFLASEFGLREDG